MRSINRVPPEERKHYIECFRCGHYIDQRYLSVILYHESGACLNGQRKKWVNFVTPGVNKLRQVEPAARPAMDNEPESPLRA
jgi:hypothetical protein